MALEQLLELTKKQHLKKNPKADIEFRPASQEPPPTGLILDNPLLEFILDRRFLAFGRFVLVYGKKSCAKTSLFLDIAKTFQAAGGDVVWIETEHAIDLDYAAKQGVDLTRVAVLHPETLEEGLGLAESIIRNMPKAYPDGETPVLICFDSLAGATPEYETDSSNTMSDIQPGLHARLLSRFYREMEKPLANERCVFLMLNQLKSKIGGFGWGEDAQDALIGGEAQFFHSSVHLKMAKIGELQAPTGEDKVERKVGSVHKIQCKRNKLGREGKGQEVEVDLYINGGMDWWCPLVRHLGKNYPSVVQKSGSYYYWVPADVSYTAQDGTEQIIDPEKAYREAELADVIRRSHVAKNLIRQAYGIPELPAVEEVAEVESRRKKKRKKNEADTEEPSTKRVLA